MAAGSGTRTGLDFPKQYLEMSGETVLRRTVRGFLDADGIDHVLVVINPRDEDLYKEAVAGLDLLPFAPGGDTRQDSVRNGLEALAPLAPDQVLIHDAARPFFTPDLINRCLAALKDHTAVLPAQPMVDTLKSVDGDRITGTVDRDSVVAAQTPQCFRYGPIMEAHERFRGRPVTDDIALAELAGIPVQWIAGEAGNTKITTREDVKIITSQELTDIRTGLGFDVHAFADDRDMWLGGVQIPYERGLKGHSDADVALHAITDAILGAIGEGDIGTHFPPSDDQWKGASSDRFLAHAASLVTERGGRIANIDLTIMCEAPKIGPHREAMRQRIGEIVGLDPSRVSVKGTTTEKLGFTGRREGIAAQAITTVRLPE